MWPWERSKAKFNACEKHFLNPKETTFEKINSVLLILNEILNGDYDMMCFGSDCCKKVFYVFLYSAQYLHALQDSKRLYKYSPTLKLLTFT